MSYGPDDTGHHDWPSADETTQREVDEVLTRLRVVRAKLEEMWRYGDERARVPRQHVHNAIVSMKHRYGRR